MDRRGSREFESLVRRKRVEIGVRTHRFSSPANTRRRLHFGVRTRLGKPKHGRQKLASTTRETICRALLSVHGYIADFYFFHALGLQLCLITGYDVQLRAGGPGTG